MLCDAALMTCDGGVQKVDLVVHRVDEVIKGACLRRASTAVYVMSDWDCLGYDDHRACRRLQGEFVTRVVGQ
jgi:hypothetical protein